LLPVLTLDEFGQTDPSPDEAKGECYVAVFSIGEKQAGLLLPGSIDLQESVLDVDHRVGRAPGVVGTLTIDGRPVRLLDPAELARSRHADWFAQPEHSNHDAVVVLFAEDSPFFRREVSSFLRETGHEVIECVDGQEAWNELRRSSPCRADIVLTDLEMPVMDGFTLCRQIKQQPDLQHLPVIALTSMSDLDTKRKAEACGFDEYQTKLDKNAIRRAMQELGNRLASARHGEPSNSPYEECQA
jgi:two-component system chemotaxis sensor kinase CheA